ncbi:hypothetical protein [Furfurilactobacillus curtus]|uniref:hypothetical protein n=1 Tax=Furfurilactobacillus curtus TaxID=1746200 RepID=UPI0038B3283D
MKSNNSNRNLAKINSDINGQHKSEGQFPHSNYRHVHWQLILSLVFLSPLIRPLITFHYSAMPLLAAAIIFAGLVSICVGIWKLAGELINAFNMS